MLWYFPYIDYYCSERFSTLVFSARGALKLATQAKLQKYFGKCTLPVTKQVQTKISRFLKPTKEKENNDEVIYVGGNCLRFHIKSSLTEVFCKKVFLEI